ncbi:MAG: BRO family protein [Aquabacterium sp.]
MQTNQSDVFPMPVPAVTLRPFDWQGMALRSFMDDKGVPWFVAKDVCDALGLSNTARALARLDDDERGVTTVNTLGGDQVMSTINESGFYALVQRSRKPEAKVFKRWLTHDVLPAIRRDGVYIRGEEALTQAAYTSKINAQWTAQEHEWKMKENTAMGPIIQMAHSGDVAGAQQALDKLSRQGFFLAHPEDLDKWQKLTISTGDRAMTLTERKTWNTMYEGIWQGKVGPHDIVHAGLPPKDTKDLTMVYMDWWKQQQANIAAGRQTDALANLFKNQVAMATMRARLDALPQIPDAVKNFDFGGVLTNKVEEIRAEATQRMYQSMADAKGDEVAFEKSSSRIAELTSKHIQDVLRGNGVNDSTRDWWMQKPAYINHDSWESFAKDYEAGLVPKDPELVNKTYTWFRQARGRR